MCLASCGNSSIFIFLINSENKLNIAFNLLGSPGINFTIFSIEDTKSSFSKCVSSTKSPFGSSSFERIESSYKPIKNKLELDWTSQEANEAKYEKAREKWRKEVQEYAIANIKKATNFRTSYRSYNNTLNIDYDIIVAKESDMPVEPNRDFVVLHTHEYQSQKEEIANRIERTLDYNADDLVEKDGITFEIIYGNQLEVDNAQINVGETMERITAVLDGFVVSSSA